MTKTQYNESFSREDISFRLAAGVLLHKKEISFSDIQALPMVEDDEEVEKIIDLLANYFDIEKTSKKITSWPALQWETVIKLKAD